VKQTLTNLLFHDPSFLLCSKFQFNGFIETGILFIEGNVGINFITCDFVPLKMNGIKALIYF